MSNKKFVNVFVYGTLQYGERLHGVMEGINADFVDYGRTTENFVMYSLRAFPAIQRGPAVTDPSYEGTNVYGEVYEVPIEGIATLDEVEGVPFLYDRKVCEVDLENGQKRKCFYYDWVHKNEEQYKRVEIIYDGDWIKFNESQGDDEFEEYFVRNMDKDNE